MHFTRQQIIDKSLELGGNKDLLAKGMATNGKDVFCIISHAGAYADGEYYLNGVEHPQTIDYFGIYPVNYKNPLHSSGSESKKNICVINTKNNDGFVFVFERVSKGNDWYFFHGKYKYESHTLKINPFDKMQRNNSILFKLKLHSITF